MKSSEMDEWIPFGEAFLQSFWQVIPNLLVDFSLQFFALTQKYIYYYFCLMLVLGRCIISSHICRHLSLLYIIYMYINLFVIWRQALEYLLCLCIFAQLFANELFHGGRLLIVIRKY